MTIILRAQQHAEHFPTWRHVPHVQEIPMSSQTPSNVRGIDWFRDVQGHIIPRLGKTARPGVFVER
jgi:hypothetical protein